MKIKGREYRKPMAAVMAGLTALSLLVTPLPAKAQLDELLREDVPYTGMPVDMNLEEITETRMHRVQPGDTLTYIAGQYGVELNLLASVNGLHNSDMIQVGQTLTVPGSEVSHRVRPGETLWDIALRYRVPLSELAELNRLEDENRVYAGDTISVPLSSRAALLPAWNPSIALPAGQLAWPVTGWVSSPFGMRDGRPHEGVDLAADHGEPIKAVKSGQVVFSGPRGTYGLTVIIDHGEGMRTLYAHASELLVQEGEWVGTGQLIARVGNTGRSYGPHLHLEVLLNGVPHDPMPFLNKEYA